jgi:solute carrier family 35 protein E3
MPLLPPALSLAFNFLSAVGLILINQFVFTLIRFDFPIALSTFHFAVTWLAVELLRRAGVFKAKQQASGGGGGGGAAPMTRELWLLSLAKGLGTPLNNLSLRHNSIAVAQISKLLVTPAILLVQWLLLREKVTLARAAWLALVCGGVGWATVRCASLWWMMSCAAPPKMALEGAGSRGVDSGFPPPPHPSSHDTTCC